MSLFYEHLLARYNVHKYGYVTFIGKLKELSTKSDIVKRSCRFKDFGVIVGGGTIEEYYLALPSSPVFLKLDNESLQDFVYRVEHSITYGFYLLSSRINNSYKNIDLINEPTGKDILLEELYSVIYSKPSFDTYILSPLVWGQDVRVFIGEFGLTLDMNKKLMYIYPFRIEGINKDIIASAKYLELSDGNIFLTICNVLHGEIGNYTERLEPYQNINLHYKNWTIRFVSPICLYGTVKVSEVLENILYSTYSKGCIIRVMTSDLESVESSYRFTLYDYLAVRLLHQNGNFFYRLKGKNVKYKKGFEIPYTEHLINNKIYEIHVQNNNVLRICTEQTPDSIKTIERISALSKGYKGTENIDVILMKEPGMEKLYIKIIIEKILEHIKNSYPRCLIVNKLGDLRLEGTTRKLVEDNGTVYIAKYNDRIVSSLQEVKTVLNLIGEYKENQVVTNEYIVGLDNIIIGRIEKEENIMDLW